MFDYSPNIAGNPEEYAKSKRFTVNAGVAKLDDVGRKLGFNIPIENILTQVFGIVNPKLLARFSPDIKHGDEAWKDFINYDSNDENAEFGTPASENPQVVSLFGKPLVFWMQFVDGKYNYRSKGEIKNDREYRGFTLPFTSVATFSRAKRFTETYIVGQRGSIIEEYGFEPWDIRIQGLILNGERNELGELSVKEQMKNLNDYESLSDKIQVRRPMFTALAINYMAIKSINFPIATNYNPLIVQPFEISAREVADDIDLLIN